MNRQVLTVANLVSSLRLLTVPVFWWTILTDRLGVATAIVVVVGSTDWLDGFLARRLDQVTELGKFLDPLADRLMIASAVIGGLVIGVVPTFFAIPLIARELLVAGGAVFLARRRVDPLPVRFRGKLATLLVYVAVPAFYLARSTTREVLFSTLGWLIGEVGLFLYWWVAFEYADDIRRALSAKDAPTALV